MKSTKRRLTLSVVSLIICMAMMIGTTFAWFTDSVTSGTNRIIAGNLDVEFYYKNGGTNGNYLTVNNAAAGTANPFFVDADGNEILWEPGVVTVTYFKVANLGTLDFKYLFTTPTTATEIDGHTLDEVMHRRGYRNSRNSYNCGRGSICI